MNYNFPIVATTPVTFAVSGANVSQAELYSGGTLLSVWTAEPAPEVKSDETNANGTKTQELPDPPAEPVELDFFRGAPFHVEIAPKTFVVVTSDRVPSLVIRPSTTPAITKDIHEELVEVSTKSGWQKKTIVYSRKRIGYRRGV